MRFGVRSRPGDVVPVDRERIVGERGLYQGSALTTVDPKGRVAIPANLRSTLERNSDARFVVVTVHPKSPCLVGYDLGWSRERHRELKDQEKRLLERGEAIDYNVFRDAYNVAEEVPFDNSGRFLLPGFLRMKGGLKDVAFFQGYGDYFEIWNPDALLAAPDVSPMAQELVRYLLDQRSGK